MACQSTLTNAADCSIVETFRTGGAPTVRTYQVPPPEIRTPRDNAWDRAPYVKAVARCGRLLIFQVVSHSKDAWVVDRATLEESRGETFQANVLPFNTLEDGHSVNVIAAKVPAAVNFSKLKLHLVGKDGRVAEPEARDLP